MKIVITSRRILVLLLVICMCIGLLFFLETFWTTEALSKSTTSTSSKLAIHKEIRSGEKFPLGKVTITNNDDKPSSVVVEKEESGANKKKNPRELQKQQVPKKGKEDMDSAEEGTISEIKEALQTSQDDVLLAIHERLERILLEREKEKLGIEKQALEKINELQLAKKKKEDEEGNVGMDDASLHQQFNILKAKQREVEESAKKWLPTIKVLQEWERMMILQRRNEEGGIEGEKVFRSPLLNDVNDMGILQQRQTRFEVGEDSSSLFEPFHSITDRKKNKEEQENNGDHCPGLRFPHPFVSSPALPLADFKEGLVEVTSPPFAYVTFATSSEFVMAAAVLMHSIALTGTRFYRIVCISKSISLQDRRLLSAMGAQLILIDSIPSPQTITVERYRDTFTKLRIWQLVMFEKLVYIDTDVVITKNIDDLFDLEEWSVPMDANMDRYSTGMMVVEPSLSTFQEMMTFLAKTKTSMELPDLLFLKDFFERKAATATEANKNSGGTKKFHVINIIPRWYQVYQDEFDERKEPVLSDKQYQEDSTAAAAVKKKKMDRRITIFDERIRGIHYPGPDKPWDYLFSRWLNYSSYFCLQHYPTSSSSVSDLRLQAILHEPNFIWFMHYARMKHTLSKLPPTTSASMGRRAKEKVKGEKKLKEDGKSSSSIEFDFEENSSGAKILSLSQHVEMIVWYRAVWKLQILGIGFLVILSCIFLFRLFTSYFCCFHYYQKCLGWCRCSKGESVDSHQHAL